MPHRLNVSDEQLALRAERGETSLPALLLVSRRQPSDRLAFFLPPHQQFVACGLAVFHQSRAVSVYVPLVVPTLAPRDRMQLEAAAGWLMLNNSAEALREFQQVSPAGRQTPQALVTLWEVYAHMGEWEKAVSIADQLIQKMDHQPDGYIKRAYALHELKRSQEAWDTLHPISGEFVDNWLIPYNLACYAAQLGKPTDALKWFRRALRVGNERELLSMALADSDLEPIRTKIEKLNGGVRGKVL